MEGAAAPEILTALTHNAALAEQLHQVVGFAYLAYVLVTEDVDSFAVWFLNYR